MAWEYTVDKLSGSPYLIHKISVTTTDSASATALTHEGPALVPDIVIPVLSSAADVGGVAISASSTTTVTAAPETSGDTFDIYCIWIAQADGGIALPG